MSAPDPAPTHHYILTLARSRSEMSTHRGTIPLTKYATELAVLDHLIDRYGDGAILFYRLVPLVPEGLPEKGGQ